ncbi:MAG: hypothetical protein HKP41_06145 [Desulfobacterales bacterium]|nr:hypothetical protein [Deltaproteobacteria bacterium]NNK93915.1 hypothetical protein [Desulfobacterales bacterium]
MADSDRKKVKIMVVSEAYSADLRGRQSVRTTFKLSPRYIDALSLLAGQLGIKQKSLFDHLIDDTQSLRAIAEELQVRGTLRENRIAKTFVISRRSLESLEQVSKRFETPRDALVEFSIERILPLINEEKRKHENRKILSDSLEKFMHQGRELLQEADQLLDREDPVFEKILNMVGAVKSGCDEIDEVIEKGKRLEEF